MKTVAFYIAATLAVVAVVFAAMYAVRWFSSAATPISTASPKPGVTCATMITGDGAAISCWKD